MQLPPEGFPTEAGCFTYRYLLPFRFPQVPCSPQAQGALLSHPGGTRLIVRDHQKARMTLADGDMLRGGMERNKGTDLVLSTKTRNSSYLEEYQA